MMSLSEYNMLTRGGISTVKFINKNKNVFWDTTNFKFILLPFLEVVGRPKTLKFCSTFWNLRLSVPYHYKNRLSRFKFLFTNIVIGMCMTKPGNSSPYALRVTANTKKHRLMNNKAKATLFLNWVNSSAIRFSFSFVFSSWPATSLVWFLQGFYWV